jgi:hypothetical protein
VLDFDSLNLINWLIFALLGRLLMFLWIKQPLSGWLGKRYKVLGQLFGCGLCLGVWTYWILAFLLKIRLIDTMPLVGEFLLGCVTSFLVWVFEAGWNTLFRNYILGADDD